MDDLDLRIGNPEFLGPYWNTRKLAPVFVNSNSTTMSYQDSSGDGMLKFHIKTLHKAVGNADTLGRHIIVGGGATQVLAAALYAAKADSRSLYIEPPYYFRFPMIAETAGFSLLKSRPIGRGFAEIITAPSNPMNTLPTRKSTAQFKVYDLCYNWAQYGIPTMRNEDIMIYSLSKATGHASSRIGWAIVKNFGIAKAMTDYMEFSSGGVSAESQSAATSVISNQLGLFNQGKAAETVFAAGKTILDKRWEVLSGLKSERFKIHNSSGMFAWMTYGNGIAVNDLYRETGIRATPGDGCGGTPNQVRLNVGCTDEKYWKLVRRLFAVN
jgi:L-tryptophan--pyruvate aminotransferase